MSQCEANNNDFVRQNDPFIIIDPFKDYLTKATSTQISTALVAK
jgi:hypothetical protein